jgi:hypothetical protein
VTRGKKRVGAIYETGHVGHIVVVQRGHQNNLLSIPFLISNHIIISLFLTVIFASILKLELAASFLPVALKR